MAAVDQASIDMVVEVIGHIDKSLIANALRANHGNVETVIIEWFDDSDKVSKTLPDFSSCAR
jgi:CUE domain.